MTAKVQNKKNGNDSSKEISIRMNGLDKMAKSIQKRHHLAFSNGLTTQ